PIEGKRAPGRTGAPEGPLGADPDAPVGDSEQLGLFLCQGRDQLLGSDAPLRLAHGEPLQSQPRHLAPALLLDPGPLLAEHLLHLNLAHRPRRGQPHRLTPGHLQPPPPPPVPPGPPPPAPAAPGASAAPPLRPSPDRSGRLGRKT